MPDHMPEKKDFAPFQADFTPFNADLNKLENQDFVAEKAFLMFDQISRKNFPTLDHAFFAPFHASTRAFCIAFPADDANDLMVDHADFQKILDTTVQNKKNPESVSRSEIDNLISFFIKLPRQRK